MGALSDMLFSQLGVDPKSLAEMGDNIGKSLADFQQRLTRIETKLDTLLTMVQNGKVTAGSDSTERPGTGSVTGGSIPGV